MMNAYINALFVAFLAFIFVPVSQAAVYSMPQAGDDLVGEALVIQAQKGDTLLKIANRYDVGIHEIREANPHVGRRLKVGTDVIVPTLFILPDVPRRGIVINVAELRLYYFTPDGESVHTYPVGLGRRGWRTPMIYTMVAQKERDPIWFVPESIRASYYRKGKYLPAQVKAGPKNPLGPYALHLAKRGYLIHGNNSPRSVGRLISSGCIRMRNSAIKIMHALVPVGTPVRIIHHAKKAGWLNGFLYLESQLPVRLNAPEGEFNHNSEHIAIEGATHDRVADVNWEKVDEVTKKATGVPKVVGERSKVLGLF